MGLLDTFELLDYLQLGVGVLTLVPFVLLLRYYRKTHLKDYLFFSGVFFSASINAFNGILRRANPENVIFSQIQASTFTFISLFLFLHVIGIKWETPPKFLWYVGIIWFSIIQFSILFFERIDVPSNPKVLFMRMRPTEDTDIDIAIMTKNDNIILGQQFKFLSYTYLVFILVIFIYCYITADLVIKSDIAIKARLNWISSASALLILPIMYIGHWFDIWTVNESVGLGTFVLVALSIGIILIRYPEAVLITYTQLMRVIDLYSHVQSFEAEKEVKKFGMDRLVEYLQMLPPEVFQQPKVANENL